MSIPNFKLLDGTSIPWLGWGNGTEGSRENPVETGKQVLDAGIRHIDTAQGYENEPETNETLFKSGSKVDRTEVWLTTKCELLPLSLDLVFKLNCGSSVTRKRRSG